MTSLRSKIADFHPEMLRAALEYAGSGRPVFPCRPAPDKSPLTRHGFKDATTDPEQIRAWWREPPDASIGAPTGVTFWVLDEDVDPEKGIDGCLALEELEKEHGRLPDTYTVRTPRGGRHRWFLAAEGVTNSTGGLPAGIDVRGRGGYALVPPSEGYEVARDLPIAPAPEWLLELVRSPRPRLTVHEGQGEGRETRSRFKLPERILESMPSRNRTLYGYGCSLRAHGWGHAAILEELLGANAERCVPPMDEAEVRKVAQSAASHEPGNASTGGDEVLGAVAFLAQKARQRTRSGLGGASRWAVYRALLECASRHGWIHGERAVAVRISFRELRREAGLGSKSTLSSALKALYKSHLVYRPFRNEDAIPGVLALRLPEGYVPVPIEPPTGYLPSTGTPLYPSALHRLRHGYSLGKLAGDVLEQVVECPGACRRELAERLGPGRKPETLRRPLRKLLDLGLVERVGGGYRPVEDWEHVLDRERTISGEKKAENLARQRDEREQDAYRLYLEEKRRRLEEREDDPRGAHAPDDGPQQEPDVPHEEDRETVGSVADVLALARSVLGVIPPERREDPPLPAPEKGRDPLVVLDTAKARSYRGVRGRDLERRTREGLPPWIRIAMKEKETCA